MSKEFKPLHEAHTEIKVGDERVDLTYDNTILYEFGHGFEAMNHTYLRNVLGKKALFVYNNPDLFNQLKEKEYPRVFTPEPNPQEVDSYVGYQTTTIDDDLKELQENE